MTWLLESAVAFNDLYNTIEIDRRSILAERLIYYVLLLVRALLVFFNGSYRSVGIMPE